MERADNFWITNIGREHIAGLAVGEDLVIDRVAVGSGNIYDTKINPLEIAELIAPVATATRTNPVRVGLVDCQPPKPPLINGSISKLDPARMKPPGLLHLPLKYIQILVADFYPLRLPVGGLANNKGFPVVTALIPFVFVRHDKRPRYITMNMGTHPCVKSLLNAVSSPPTRRKPLRS